MRASAFLTRHVPMAAVVLISSLPLSPAAAQADTGHRLNIPSQRLISALSELGRQSRTEILLTAPGKENLITPAISGPVSVRQALIKMTRRMNLSVRQVGTNVYVIEAKTPRTPSAPPTTATAASASPPAATDPPAIMVSARRRSENPRYVPLMIQQFGPDALSTYAVRDLSDIARITPGFVATGQTSNAAPLLVIRGQRRSLSDENRIPLAIYVDEVPMPNQAALSPLFDIASVAVVRGPQGTIFGRNTTSGAVLVNSAQPGQNVPSYLEVDRGNFSLSRLEGAVEIPVLSGVDLRISGQRLRRGGYARLTSGERADDAHSDAFRALLRLAPADNFRSTFSFDALRGDEKGAVQILTGAYANGGARSPDNAPYFDCGTGACDIDHYVTQQEDLGNRTSQSGLPPLFRRRFMGASNITEYGDDRFLIRNIIGWRSTDLMIALDGDATPLPINDSTTFINLRQWTEELQFQGESGPFRYLLGAFYLDNAPNGPMLQYSGQFERPDNPVTIISNYYHFKSAALFGQGTVKLGKGRSVELGLRYTRETSRGCALRSITLAPNSHDECLSVGGAYNHYQSGRLTWTATLNQQIGQNMFYVSSRRAFRSGGYNSPNLGGNLAGFQTFRPETITDFEGGAKGQWSTGTFSGQFSIAAYIGFYHDIQRALFPSPGFDGDDAIGNDPVTLYINSARARIAGVDLDMSAAIGSRTRITLSAAFIDTRYTRVDAPAILENLLGTNPISNRFSYTARLSGTISLSHEIPLGYDRGSLLLSGDYAHNSHIRFAERINDPFATQPAYGLFGASLSWKNAGGLPVDISLWGRNLANTYYASGGGTLNPLYTAATLIPAPPRTFGLRLRYSFR